MKKKVLKALLPITGVSCIISPTIAMTSCGHQRIILFNDFHYVDFREASETGIDGTKVIFRLLEKIPKEYELKFFLDVDHVTFPKWFGEEWMGWDNDALEFSFDPVNRYLIYCTIKNKALPSPEIVDLNVKDDDTIKFSVRVECWSTGSSPQMIDFQVVNLKLIHKTPEKQVE